ncbi:methyltransferase domain-containing protein [Thermocrinis minervae]|uniref:ADP-heptose:LPS heptosyltransferase n=1 Tax=Thermocrinis minervae TaxID=381751 RepID=A0A1M6QLM5_9AQUI|nr:methyltransferase domain-containing protein [Thermocrinis minervae]SHK21141.1 ADP-heptose:LPS heptosyltransferase [Thermocrinis minervae]
MLVVRVKTGGRLNFNGYSFDLKPGQRLLFAKDVFNLLKEDYKRLFEEDKLDLPPVYRGENLNGKVLFVFMQGAIGDVLCSTVALREIKRRYPRMKLWVAVSGKAKPILEDLPYVDRLLPHPTPLSEVKKADYMVKAVEMVGGPQFDSLNMVEYFLWKFYLYHAQDETPDVVVKEDIRRELEPIFEKIREISGGKKVLLFHYLASSVHRTLPPKLLKDLQELIRDEYIPVVCSLPTEDITVNVSFELYGIQAVNLSPYMKTVKHLIAAVSLSDAVVTADTSTLHIAGALKKPTVLISGPVEPYNTAGTYPTVIPVRANYTGQTCRAPCGIHAIAEPCNEAKLLGKYYSPCLESIPSKVIALALKDAQLLSQEDFPKPEVCPVCEHTGSFHLFEVINGHRIFECPSCGLQFAHPLKAMDYEKAYEGKYEDLLSFTNIPYESYTKVSTAREEIERWSALPRINVLLPILSVLPKGKHLDVGCSTGFFMLIAKKYGFESYGFDASEKAVKIAKERFNLRVVKAFTFKDLPEDFKGPYKLITAFEVLEHLEDPVGFLREVYSMLEEGGLYLMSCPPYFKFENTALGYRKYKWWYGDYPPNHLTRWKPWTLHYALKKAGFDEVIIFTEPLIPGTVLEGITPPEVILQDQKLGNITIPRSTVTQLIINTLKPLYLNSRLLGNFQFAIAVKGKSDIDWERVVSRAIRLSAVEIIYNRDDLIL